MKKVLTLTICMLTLVTLTGLNAAQEERKIPPANRIRLTIVQGGLSKKPCSVIAQPYLNGNNTYTYPYQMLTFDPPTAVLSPPAVQWITDATGKLKVTIKRGTTVTAKMGTVTSNSVSCLSNASPS